MGVVEWVLSGRTRGSEAQINQWQRALLKRVSVKKPLNRVLKINRIWWGGGHISWVRRCHPRSHLHSPRMGHLAFTLNLCPPKTNRLCFEYSWWLLISSGNGAAFRHMYPVINKYVCHKLWHGPFAPEVRTR